MFGRISLLLGATLLAVATTATAQEATADEALEGWLGVEYTIEPSALNEYMPSGGKLSFIFDSTENVVRVCTRAVPGESAPWRMDFASPCAVTMSFTRGTRYCTVDDVKAGNAEVLASCHRLRARDVAMHPSAVAGTLELNDLIVFLVRNDAGQRMVSILVDSPSRVTDGGVIHGCCAAE